MLNELSDFEKREGRSCAITENKIAFVDQDMSGTISKKGEETMNNQKTIFKSKTINFNAVIVSVIALLAAFGIKLPAELQAPEAIAAFVALINIVLRLFTSKAVTFKGGAANEA